MLPAPKVTDISGLQSALAFWEQLDYLATIVVFLGVLGELLAEFTNLFRTRDHEHRKKAATVTSTVILLVGLAGELPALIRTSTLTGRITEALRNDVSSAYQSACQATLAASNVNERAKRLAGENLNLAIRLEQERQRTLELERKLAPRFLTASESAAVTRALRPYAGHEIRVMRLGDAEAGQYADQFIRAINAAGWNVDVTAVGILAPPRYGVICDTSVQPDAATGALISILRKVGVGPIVYRTQILSPPPQLVIALKPPS